MRALFYVPYPTQGPSNRYRVEQFLPYLKKEGIEYSLRPFMSSEFFKIIYKKGNSLRKFYFFILSTFKRMRDLAQCGKFDLIFVHIEAFPFGPPLIEWIASRLKKVLVYDFEDAVYLPNFKGENKIFNSLRCPGKFYRLINFSDHVIVCNRYMRDFVLPFNRNVTVIPTSIDTDKFTLKDYNNESRVPVIGWIGSHTTVYCLKQLGGVFRELAKKHDFFLKVVGGGKDFSLPGVRVINQDWRLERDVDDFQSLDIGVYPLPSDERAMAKTPFKTIQYMAVGVPVVASRVGGNIEIIEDGRNSFLAATDDEWIEKLSLLLEDASLRKRLGICGRKTVEEKYSVKVNIRRFVEVLKRSGSE